MRNNIRKSLLVIGALLAGPVILNALFLLKCKEKEKPMQISIPLVHKVDSIYATLTLYNNTTSQCGKNPNFTSSGKEILKPERWIAVSRDLRKKYRLHDGDTLILQSETLPYFNGPWSIEDVSSARIKNTIEILVSNPHQIKIGFAIKNQLFTITRK